MLNAVLEGLSSLVLLHVAATVCKQSWVHNAESCRKPARPTPEEEAEAVRQKVQAFEREAEQKKQQADKEVEDMLTDLKKRLNEQ